MEYRFSYGIDGVHFLSVPGSFIATAGIWVGAKFGFYVLGNTQTGSLVIDWIRISPLDKLNGKDEIGDQD